MIRSFLAIELPETIRFVETLEAIRANFQTIYRKAFGGGRADIVLEEGGDLFECGVESLAPPPGKPTFNNSLLSGGEKALTAVALLLAIFEFRPSSFCVLDEVDAPFDEANIGRFIDVLKLPDLLSRCQQIGQALDCVHQTGVEGSALPDELAPGSSAQAAQP